MSINTHIKQAIKKTDKTFRGLGVPTALLYCVTKADVSSMVIGTMGAGKGVLVDLVKLTDRYTVAMDSVTKTDISAKFGSISNTALHVTVEEMASLSQYQRDILQTILAKVITDRSYESESSKINIQNCKMTMYCGIQPATFTQMVKQNQAWENLTSDRFIKILLVNAIRDDDVEKYDITSEWYAEIQEQFNALFRVEPTDVKVRPEALDIMRKLLRSQISGNRANIYAKKILQAWASMNNKKTATVALANSFVDLFGFYFAVFDTFTIRQEVGDNLEFRGALTTTFMAIVANQRFDTTKQEYVDMMRVDESTWRRNARQLVDMEIVEEYKIEVETNAGKRKATSYRISGKIAEHFERYRQVIKI